MPGPAVTVVDSGGIPVVAVPDNAPPLSVVDSGGFAVTLADIGAPFVLEGFPAPAWTVQPSIAPTTGDVGTVFTGSDGTITNGTVTARAWLLDGVIIPGATGTTVTPTAAGSLVYRVTAEGIGGTATEDSAPVAIVQPVPVNTAVPVVSGTPQVGETLTATQGTWTNSPTGYTYQWQRNAGAWANIAGATAATYTPVEGDVGATIRVRVIASNEGGAGAGVFSAATDPVADVPVVSPFAPFTVTAGTGNDGDTGYYSTIYGAVSAEPLAGFPLLEFSTRTVNYTQVAFTGDCLSTAAGWKPVIDGVTIGTLISDWAYDAVGNTTSATWNSTGVMTDTQQYVIDQWIQE